MGEQNNTELTEEQQKQMQQLQDWVRQQTKASFEEYQQQQQQQVQERQSPKDDDPLAEMIGQYVNPALQQANLHIADAKDYSTFYRSRPDAGEFEGEIEETFQQLMDAGRPASRADIHAYILGKKMRENPEAFYEKMQKQREQEKQRAEFATDSGASGLSKVLLEKGLDDPDKLSQDELKQALKGMVF